MKNEVPCPYCGHPVAVTFDHTSPRERELFGEHCDRCFLPFEIDEQGPLGQDGERPAEIRAEGIDLTEAERSALWAVTSRLNAKLVSLYRTSEGLRAFVIDRGGGEHLGVPVAHLEDQHGS